MIIFLMNLIACSNKIYNIKSENKYKKVIIDVKRYKCSKGYYKVVRTLKIYTDIKFSKCNDKYCIDIYNAYKLIQNIKTFRYCINEYKRFKDYVCNINRKYIECNEK